MKYINSMVPPPIRIDDPACKTRAIAATSISTAIALNQNSVTSPSGNLDVSETVRQSWKVALAVAIAATSISAAIALNQNSVTSPSGNLDVGETVRQS